MKTEQKKGVPGGFFLLVLAAIVLIFGLQSINGEKGARVSFSHQAEHLTNLQLTVPEENHKIAQNENLVTFGGRFKDHLEEESIARFKYLEFLYKNHELKEESTRLKKELETTSAKVIQAASLYLGLTGVEIPRSGFVVVGNAFDTQDRSSSIIVSEALEKEPITLPQVRQTLAIAKQSPTTDSVDAAYKELRDFVGLLRSPALGV